MNTIEQPVERTLPWVELLEALFRRKVWIIVAIAAGLGYGLIWAVTQPELYRADTRILLSAQPVPGPREAAMPDKQVKTEIALLRSTGLVKGLLEARGVTPEHPVEEPPNPVHAFFRRFLPGQRSLDARAAALANRIEAAPVDNSNLVEVAIVDEDPQWAAAFVNDLVRQHVHRIGVMGEQSGAETFYDQQSELLAERWQHTRRRVSEYRERHGDTLLANDYDQLRAVVTNLENALVGAQTQVLELQARSEFLRRGLDQTPERIDAESTMAEDESVKMLRGRILELEMERSELLSRYTPESTLVRDIDRRIEEAKNLLDTKAGETLSERTTTLNPSHQALQVDLLQTEAQLTAARARVSALREQVLRYRADLGRLEIASGELDRLMSEAESAQKAYQDYSARAEAARFESAISESGIVNVSIVETADVPSSPIEQPVMERVAFLAILGLGLGVLLALGRDLLDPTVRSPLRVQRVTELPIAAHVPAA